MPLISPTQAAIEAENESRIPAAPGVPVTLCLQPEVHAFFDAKAQKAGVGLDTYLERTLAIVLGCKAFNAASVCMPQTLPASHAASTAHPNDAPR